MSIPFPIDSNIAIGATRAIIITILFITIKSVTSIAFPQLYDRDQNSEPLSEEPE